jgi:pyruvate dehydrogenase E2 component (dihydrolipoyllysine-residue acetyltransferase)
MAQTVGAKGEVRIEQPDRVQRTIARRSAESRATIPDVELTAEAQLPADSPDPTTAALVRACALALKDVPRANGSYRDGAFELYSRINIGVVITAEDTYAIPTVLDADQKSVGELNSELERLAARAVAGELSAPELAGATFTLWHPGSEGVASATPVIVPSQAAALAAGAVREVAVVRQGAAQPARAMTLTLACDHRILYGTLASRFLGRIKTLIQEGTQ